MENGSPLYVTAFIVGAFFIHHARRLDLHERHPILRCDSKAIDTLQKPNSGRLPPIHSSIASHQRTASLVACRAASCCRAVDRPTHNGSSYAAPRAVLDSPHALSQAVQIHSAPPNLAQSAARCHRCGGRAFLPASWIWLARDSTRCRGRHGRRSHARRFHDHAAADQKLVLRNGPLLPPQGCGVHPGTGGRTRPRQAADPWALPQCRWMGSWYLWRRVSVSLLWQNLAPEYRPPTGGTARRHSPGSPKATARAHE